VGVVFHPNPVDSRAIGPLVKKYAVTFLLATPTFLQIYLRGCDPAVAVNTPDFRSTGFHQGGGNFGLSADSGRGCGAGFSRQPEARKSESFS